MSIKSWTCLAILSLFWGGSFLFVEVALRGLPVLSIVWLRVALAAAVLGLWLMVTGAGFPKRARLWGALLVMGGLNNVLPFTLFVLAQGQISGGLASILNATTPLWTVLVAHILTQDERLTWAKMAGLSLGFFGVLVIAGFDLHAGNFWAVLACLGAALSYGIAAIWGRRFRATGLGPIQVAFGMLAGSTLMLGPFWAVWDQPWRMAWPDMTVMAAVAALAVVSTALAYILYFRLLASAGATMVSLVTFVIPASAIGLGFVVLGEMVSWQDLLGLTLILAGLLAMDGRLWPPVQKIRNEP